MLSALNILFQSSEFLPASCGRIRHGCYHYLQILTFLNKRLKRLLKQIFYKIREDAVFPVSWKNSAVVPTYKRGCKSDVESYWQVSLLTIAIQNFERLFICLYVI